MTCMLVSIHISILPFFSLIFILKAKKDLVNIFNRDTGSFLALLSLATIIKVTPDLGRVCLFLSGFFLRPTIKNP